jgi:hypothetical protein
MNSKAESPFIMPTRYETRWFYLVVVGSVVLAALLLMYLWELKQSMPLIIGLVTVHILRVRSVYKDQNVLEPHKTVALITLTTIIGAIIAMVLRPAFVYMVHTMAQDPQIDQIYGGDYILAFNSKIIGYGGFWFMGYMLASKALSLAAKWFSMLRYPTTKLDVFSAFYDAADNLLCNSKLEEVKDKATGYLSGSKGQPYIADLTVR